MTFLETISLPPGTIFWSTNDFQTKGYYWDYSGLLCHAITDEPAIMSKAILSFDYTAKCDHTRTMPVGAGTAWSLKCADCLCDLEITGVKEVKVTETVKVLDAAQQFIFKQADPSVIINPCGELKTNSMPINEFVNVTLYGED